MDKSWMFTDRLSREYEDGVESFLQYALQNARDPNLISCPCAKCMNLKRKNTTTIKAHLCCHGMDLTYDRWIWHGEKIRSTNTVNEAVEMGQNDQHDEVEDHIEMVHDAYETYQDNPAQFRKLLEDAEKPLYPGNKKESTLNKFRFVNPIDISYMNKNGIDNRTQVLAERLEGVSPNQLVFVPCNVGFHWILTVIDPHKEVVYLLDSLYHRIRDESWKNVVDMAINVFNATLGRKRKKHPSWEIIKCPIQPDSKQCGFYVMRFMKEIIEGLTKSGSNSIKSMFKKDKYSEDVEIDEVRKEWANCVLEYI